MVEGIFNPKRKQTNKAYQKVVCGTALAVVGLLSSCSNYGPAPVINLSSSKINVSSYPHAPFHTVSVGDTLFSIAFNYGVDYRELAQINELSRDYLIYPGQKLYFAQQQITENSEDFDAAALRASVLAALDLPIQPAKRTERTSNRTLTESDYQRQSPKSNVSNKQTPPKVKNSARQIVTSSGNASVSSSKVSRWIWPVDGQVIESYSAALHGNKGLDISGNLGEPVRAAAPGRVVYRGNALKGYGNLVIVKHNDDFLSAYAHNSKIRVSENEIVKAGQIIADIGSSGTDKNKLHFQIRYQGKPVDPIKLLPKL